MKTKELLSASVPKDYNLPQRGTNQVASALDHGDKVRFTLMSCPDYSSDGEVYTFKNLGEGVPLLTKLHTEAVMELLAKLDPAKLNSVEIEVLMADIEAENPHLVELYSGGDYDGYKAKCDASVESVKKYLAERCQTVGQVTSSSFLRLHDESTDFLKIRNTYYELVADRFANDRVFNFYLQANVRSKQGSGYYQKEYGGQITPDDMFVQEFFTVAEYLALGMILGKRAVQQAVTTVIVVHAGSNTYYFNKAREFEPGRFGFAMNNPKLPIMERLKPVVSRYNGDDE